MVATASEIGLVNLFKFILIDRSWSPISTRSKPKCFNQNLYFFVLPSFIRKRNTTMKNLFLKDLDKDIIIYNENRFRVKRYAYSKTNFVDEKGDTITERVFSFMLEHGKKWYNDTYLHFKESELGENVIEKYKELIAKKNEERRELFTAERAMRKQFPRHLKFIFNNVTVTVIEDMAYTSYNAGYGSQGYPLIDKKEFTIYANDMPYRGLIRKEIEKDFEFTSEWVLEQMATHYIAKYNVSKLNQHNKPVSEVVIEKFDYDFVPYHFFLGLVVGIKGVQHSIINCCMGKFETDKGELVIPANELHKLFEDVVGEAGDIHAFTALKNKFKFVE